MYNLTPRQTEALALRYHDALPLRQAAEEMGLSVAAYREHVAAGLAKLSRAGIELRQPARQPQPQPTLTTGIDLDRLSPSEIRGVA